MKIIAIAGSSGSGKSTLLNRLAGREAALTSEVAGTTRDVIEVRCDFGGLPVAVQPGKAFNRVYLALHVVQVRLREENRRRCDQTWQSRPIEVRRQISCNTFGELWLIEAHTVAEQIEVS